MKRAIRAGIVLSSLACACERREPPKPVAYVPAPVAISVSDASALPSASASAPRAQAEPPADPPAPTVPIQIHEVKDGKFVAAFLDVLPPIAVSVTALPFDALPRDQRQDSGVVTPGDDYLRRAESPFTQLGTYRDAKNARHLALVEARPLWRVPPSDAPLVWWFDGNKAARAMARPAGKATMWRVWKGGAGHRAWNPDVLAVETAAGDIVAVRFLGAVYQVEPFALDPTVPMFVASELGSASGVDDTVSHSVIGLIDGELRLLLEVPAGPRSSITATEIIGPLGSITLATGAGGPAVRVRDLDPNVLCIPGAVVETGCGGAERIDTWDSKTKTFTKGTPKRVVFRQKKPGAAISVTPCGDSMRDVPGCPPSPSTY